MSKILDYYDDAHGAVLRDVLRGRTDLPEFVVKSAAIPAESMRPGGPYAWDELARFAVGAPFDAWMSAEYFKKQAHEIPFHKREAIWASIKAACEVHGFDPGVPTVKVAAAPGEFLLVKEAADGEPLQLYPVGSAEEVAASVAWFPRNLVGDLAPMRRKLAQDLLAKAREHGVRHTELLEEELAPTKRSHLLTHIQQRIDHIERTNAEADRWEPTRKAAAARGEEPPSFKRYDPRLVDAYQELRKLAYVDPTPKFWGLFENLDKAAGFHGDELFTPPGSMNREIEDDTPIPLCKLAGQYVDTHQLATKVAADVWRDVAPAALAVIGDMPALAGVVEALPARSQEILLGQLRGY